MDFVNKAYAQLADVLKGMTPGTRIAAGLLFVAIVVGLTYLFQNPMTGGDDYLLAGRPFSPAEVTQIEAAFSKAGLGKSKIVDGNRIQIPRGQKELYLAALADHNALPPDFYKYLDEAAASDNPFSSSTGTAFRRSNAKQKELALIISRMRGIQMASVQYDEEVKPGMRKDKKQTAMVAVQTTSGELEEGQKKSIRNIVATAYAGLDRRNISINDITSGLTYGGGGEDSLGDGESPYAEQKKTLERDWKLKIQDQLAWVPGAIVNVNVELSPKLRSTTRQVTVDAKPTAVQSTETTKEASSTSPQPSGRPGADPNGVIGNRGAQVAVASAAESKTTETKSENKSVPGHTSTDTHEIGLAPTRVTTAIQIPASYFAKVWREKNPAPAGQPAKEPDAAALLTIKDATLKSIQDTVANLIPRPPLGDEPYPQVKVTSFDDLPGLPLAKPTFADGATVWLADNWRSLAMVFFGAVCLAMLRGMVRSTAAQPPPAAAAPAPRLADLEDEKEPEEEAEPQVTAVLRRKFDGHGPNLKQELQEMVKADPDAAAAILRSWIGDAA